MNLKHITKDVGRFITDNSPQILSALGVVGVAGTGYFTFKAAWQAREIVIKENEHRDSLVSPELTKKEQFEKTWKLYITPAAVGVMTIGCIVAANRVQARRFAAIAAAYGVLSGDFDEFRDKASEKLGLKKADEVRSELAEKNIVGQLPAGSALPDGKTWFCDMASRRVFPSTMETVKSGMNKVNFQCFSQTDATLNDFYDAIGVEHTDVGDILGWNATKHCDIEFTPILTDSHGAVTAFKFISGPFPNY